MSAQHPQTSHGYDFIIGQGSYYLTCLDDNIIISRIRDNPVFIICTISTLDKFWSYNQFLKGCLFLEHIECVALEIWLGECKSAEPALHAVCPLNRLLNAVDCRSAVGLRHVDQQCVIVFLVSFTYQ